jgi:spermidine synthase
MREARGQKRNPARHAGLAMPDAESTWRSLIPVLSRPEKYFGLEESDKMRFIPSGGRVYLNRPDDRYHLILLDAFRELGVPFHLPTRKFYALVKSHLAPGGAVASNAAANAKL